MSARDALANLDAYDTWAASYPPEPHNPLMRSEQTAMTALLPDVAGLHALDLACGSGRYAAILAAGGAEVVATDLSGAMLRRVFDARRVRASMMELPFAAGVFDIVVSALAVGHAPRIEDWMSGVARVLKPGGILLYSDFHAAGAAAGMQRSFTDEHHRKHTLLHRNYDPAAQFSAASAAGFVIEATREVRVGIELREHFTGSAEFYRRWSGVPVVLVVRARKVRA